MDIQKSKSRIISILIHVLIWVVLGVALFLYQPLTGDIVMPVQFWIKQALLFFMLVVVYYINANILVTDLLLKNRTGTYFLSIIPITIGIVLLNNLTDKWLNMSQVMDAAFHKHFVAEALNAKNHKLVLIRKRRGGHEWDTIVIAITALVVGIGTSITAIQKWQKDQRLRLELEQDKVSSELSFLKAQINPHFFFNTLNNIYALTLINAETSRQAIHQLSRMMRYILYDTEKDQTLLSQEIAFIKDYISLMQLRLTTAVTIDVRFPEPLNDQPIAPMIFLPFIENAFKHGVSATIKSHIYIAFEQHDAILKLTVKNSVIKENTVSLDQSGIGLNNTRRRLDLLYPGKHQLELIGLTAENDYVVNLTLDLS